MAAVEEGNGAGERPAPRAWWMAAVFFLAAILSYTDRLILNVLVDPVRQSLAISDTQMSLLLGAAFAVIYALAGLPLGLLADRTRRRTVIIAGMLLWSTGMILSGFTGSYAQLFATRMLVGVGEAALAPAALSMLAGAFPPARRGFAMGLFFMGMTVGAGASTALGGFLLDAAQNGAFAALPLLGTLEPWRVVLVLAGIPGFALVLLMYSVHEPARPATAGETQSVRDSIRLLRRHAGALVPLYLAVAAFLIGDYAILGWSPTALIRRHGQAAAESGAVIGMIALSTGLVGSLLAGWLADRFRQHGGEQGQFRLLIAAAAMCFLGGVLYVAVDDPRWLLLGLTVWAFAGTIGETVGMIAVQALVPDHARGLASSLTAFCNTCFGLGLGPTLAALAAQHLYRDERAVHFAVATVLLPAAFIAGALFWTASRARNRARPTSEKSAPLHA